jgi:hypothetical protein
MVNRNGKNQIKLILFKQFSCYFLLVMLLFGCTKPRYQVCEPLTDYDIQILSDTLTPPSIEKSLDSLKLVIMSYQLKYNGEKNRKMLKLWQSKIDSNRLIRDSLEKYR